MIRVTADSCIIENLTITGNTDEVGIEVEGDGNEFHNLLVYGITNTQLPITSAGGGYRLEGTGTLIEGGQVENNFGS